MDYIEINKLSKFDDIEGNEKIQILKNSINAIEKEIENENENKNENKDENENENKDEREKKGKMLMINRTLISTIAKQNKLRIQESNLFSSLLDFNILKLPNIKTKTTTATATTAINKCDHRNDSENREYNNNDNDNDNNANNDNNNNNNNNNNINNNDPCNDNQYRICIRCIARISEILIFLTEQT